MDHDREMEGICMVPKYCKIGMPRSKLYIEMARLGFVWLREQCKIDLPRSKDYT